MTGDPRIAPVESNLFDWAPLFDTPEIEVHEDPDTFWWTSDIDFPMFTGAMNARFAAADAARRTHEVLDRLIGNGRPFLWWLTPSSRSPELEAVLVERGLVVDEPTVGMHLDLSDVSLDQTPPDGVTVEVSTDGTVDATILAMCDGFGMSRDLLGTFRDLLTRENGAIQVVNVLARVGGRPVGAGTLAVTGRIAGLYNIAVLEEARGHGVGRAVTTELVRLGVERGCTESILHATPLGLPVYARLGYQPVCEITQYLWMPAAS